jgi:hypothetical protein
MNTCQIKAILLSIAILTIPFGIFSLPGVDSELVESSDTILIVDQSGSGDFTTIQEAINASENNGTIIIKNGTYSGKILINKSVSLIGESRDGVTLKPSSELSLFIVNSSYITLSDFSILGDGDEGKSQSAFHIAYYIPDIGNLFFRNISLNRIKRTFDFSPEHIENVSIKNCDFSDTITDLVVDQNLSISHSFFSKSTRITIRGYEVDSYSEILNNTFTNLTRLEITDLLNGVFIDNYIYNVSTRGEIMLPQYNIEKNTIINIKEGEGIFCYFPKGMVIKNNLISDSKIGIKVQGRFEDDYVIISNNKRYLHLL